MKKLKGSLPLSHSEGVSLHLTSLIPFSNRTPSFSSAVTACLASPAPSLPARCHHLTTFQSRAKLWRGHYSGPFSPLEMKTLTGHFLSLPLLWSGSHLRGWRQGLAGAGLRARKGLGAWVSGSPWRRAAQSALLCERKINPRSLCSAAHSEP